MIETDAHGPAIQVDDLDADWPLSLIEDSETQSRVAERRKLRYAAQWCRLHLVDPADIDADEDIPIGIAQIREWVGHSSVNILPPVLHLDRTDAVDHHDPPTWMRELVTLRDPHCVSPWCTHDTRGCDLDHIDPYLDPTTVDHPAKPTQATSPPCAADTTAPRPDATGTTPAPPTAPTPGPTNTEPATSSPLRHPPARLMRNGHELS